MVGIDVGSCDVGCCRCVSVLRCGVDVACFDMFVVIGIDCMPVGVIVAVVAVVVVVGGVYVGITGYTVVSEVAVGWCVVSVVVGGADFVVAVVIVGGVGVVRVISVYVVGVTGCADVDSVVGICVVGVGDVGGVVAVVVVWLRWVVVLVLRLSV